MKVHTNISNLDLEVIKGIFGNHETILSKNTTLIVPFVFLMFSLL